MDRVLKRVGLSRRTLSTDATAKPPAADQDRQPKDDSMSKSQRRRRRSRSRRRASTNHQQPADAAAATTATKKTSKPRGLFNIDWDSVRDCRSCKSRALSKRFCSKKCDNELYRSNSFKFERFVRGNDDDNDVSTLGKKISLCEDYSLPVDHVNKRRPNSIAAPSASDWNISSPNEDKVEVLETYSTPRDSKQRLSQKEDVEQKCLTSPDREYSQPYTTDASSGPSSDEEFFGHNITLIRAPPQVDLNSPDSITEGILPVVVNVQSPIRTDIKRHPSPYYYSDLLKPRSADSPSKASTSKEQSQQRDFQYLQQQHLLLQSETLLTSKSECHPSVRTFPNKQQLFQTSGAEKTRNKNQKSWAGYHKKYRKSASLDNANNVERTNRSHVKYPGKSTPSTAAILFNDANTDAAGGRYADRHRSSTSPCFVGEEDALADADMSRQRHLYETAFDCRVSKSDDELNQIDKVSNHSVLSQLDSNKHQSALESVRHTPNAYQDKSQKSASDHTSLSGLSQKLEKMHIPLEASCTIAALPLRGYTPSPPSTAPLPTKFHGKELIMNSIRSAPNLPLHSKQRLKNLHLPIKSLRDCSPTNSNSTFDIQPKSSKFMSHVAIEPRAEKDIRVLEIKDRPRKDLLLFKRSKDGKGTILEFKGRRRRHKYSSTESMTTSSSGGSMESIKSSTSEGNRSTTSTDSRNSSSLSSHDSDSGAAGNYLGSQSLSGFHTQNKLHILSPISDKSSQEPVSEISDNNRNNNSQKCSPEELFVTIETTKSRRRLPQNKNLLNLGLHAGDPEIQGSDSGISIQSREGVKSRFGLTAELSAGSDFNDLPFDMPKLRRRRLVASEAPCTSSSATSIDFGDLPFDMPKLRRRLRVQQTSKDMSVSEASSSQSVVDPESQGPNFRPKLSLNLPDSSTVKQKSKPELGLSLSGIGFNSAKSPTSTHNIIDINLPLEKQGWYHGAITRVEAENVLRLLCEGSFLVRNSESTKQDYSLSLKSARGFMHMRIQRDEKNGTRSFILGQFSKPFTSIPEMIKHFSLNGLPIRGAEHMCLIQPVIAQLL